MSDDLISREAFNNALENRYLNYEFEKRGLPRLDKMSLDCHRALEAQGNVIRDVLYEQPAVDAEPVQHGKWGDLCRGKVRVCSCCKHHFDNTCNDIDGEWIFCPNCGAKMDLEDEQ